MLVLQFLIILSFGVLKGVSFVETSNSVSDFSLVPKLPKVTDGGTLSFVCTVTTYPKPPIWFILKEAVVKTDGPGYRLFQIPLGSVLRISPVSYKEYNDVDVMCTARFSAKKIRYRRTRIKVYENGTLPLGYPTISTHPTSTSLAIGQAQHVLDCEATGSPKPKIKWLKDYIPIDVNNPWMDVLVNGSLRIHGIDQSMGGIYECAAENIFGVAFSQQANLNVSREDINIKLPGPPTNLTAVKVTANHITIRWDPPAKDTFSGTLVSYELFLFDDFTKTRWRATIVTLKTEYILEDLTEGTVYKIQLAARSSHGMGLRTDTLAVKTHEYVPGRSIHVHVHIINSTAIRVGWGRPRFEDEKTRGIIRAFVVETKALDDDGVPTGFVNRTKIPVGNKMTVTGLDPSTYYSVRIWGLTRRSKGVPTAPIKVKTFRSENSPPRNITLMPLDGGESVQLNWEAPRRLMDRLITYEIMYYPRVHPPPDMIKTTTALFRTKVISDIDDDLDYVFQIRGVTIKGKTDWSRKVVFRTYGQRPDPPMNIKITRLTYWAINVTWDPPNFPVSGYKLLYHRLRNFRIGSGNTAEHRTHEWTPIEVPTVHNATIRNVEEHLPYAVKIQSRAPDGTYGPFSLPVIAAAGLKVLHDMVQDLVVLNTTSNMLRIEIVPPKTKRYKFFTLSYSGYLKFRNKYDHIEEIHDGPFHEKLLPNITEFSIKRLRPNALYDVNITANYLTHNSSTLAIHLETKEAAPYVKGRIQIRKYNPLKRTVTMTFPSMSHKYCNISHIFVIVVPSYISLMLSTNQIDTSHPDRLLDIPDNLEGRMQRPWVAASFKKRPKQFVLGDNKMYGGMHNKPLFGAREYQVFVRVFALKRHLWTDSRYSDMIHPNPHANDEYMKESNKWIGVSIFLLICFNLSIFICCGMRSGSSSEASKQPLCTRGEPPFDLDCLKRKPRVESMETLAEKDLLDSSMV